MNMPGFTAESSAYKTRGHIAIIKWPQVLRMTAQALFSPKRVI